LYCLIFGNGKNNSVQYHEKLSILIAVAVTVGLWQSGSQSKANQAWDSSFKPDSSKKATAQTTAATANKLFVIKAPVDGMAEVALGKMAATIT
jgi:hypothetical protein